MELTEFPIFEFLRTCRKQAKAFKAVASISTMLDNVSDAIDTTERVLDTVAAVGPSIPVSKLEETLRNAMAYAWEVGAGAPLTETVNASEFNPFMDYGWRNTVQAGREQAGY